MNTTPSAVIEALLSHPHTRAPLFLVRAMRNDNWPLSYGYRPTATEAQPVLVFVTAGKRADLEARARAEGIQSLTPSRIAVNLLLTTPQVHMTLDLAYVLTELNFPLSVTTLPRRKAIVTIPPDHRARFVARARELHPNDDPPLEIQPTDQLRIHRPLTD